MAKFDEKKWKEFMDNYIPGYTRKVRIVNTPNQNTNNRNNQVDKSKILSEKNK